MLRKLARSIALVTPLLALGAAGAAGAGSGDTRPRALSLNVVDSGDSVELELVALSQVTQQVEYTLELVGASRSRHAGNTSISAGDRLVLSRLKTSVADRWCATVEVSEASGARYTLTAGDCPVG
jgi:hypothetical protein